MLMNPSELAEILESMDSFIQTQASRKVPRGVVPPEVLDLESDELAQQTRVKLWKTLQKRDIRNLKAYISKIVANGAIDMVREYKKFVPLPDDE